MAKENKKATLSMEERLNAALVPDWEQPYKVPANWCWTTVNSVSEVVTGGTPSKRNSEYYGGDFPFFKPSDLDAGRNVYEASEYLTEEGKRVSRIIPAESSAVCCIGSIGKCGFLMREGTTNQQINSAIPQITPLYLYYYFQSELFLNELRGKASATTISIVNKTKMEQCSFPLAPLVEQQRIVDRIESMFAKLDEAKEKAQEVVDGYDARKAAILHKAFTGELTAEWRKQKGIAYTAWKHVTVKDVCTDVKVGIVIKPSQYYTNKEYGTAAFRSANVREFHVDDFDWVYLNEIGIRTNQRSVVHTGDVLVVRSGNPGTACVVDERYDGYNAIDILIAVPNQTIITPDYLCAFTNSPIGRNLVAENKRGIALVHFNVSGYSNLKLPLPTIEEQEEITSSLFALLEKEQQAKETAEQAIARIGAMKKAILARAFRGELGTNDPADENAVKLLKEILNIEKTPTKRAKAITIPKELSTNLKTELEKKIVKLFYQKDTKELSIKDIMTVSSKAFDVLDCLRGLVRRQLITKLENGNYRLMG